MYVGNQFNNIKLVELLQKYKAEECIEKCKERCEQNLFNIIVAACSAVILSMIGGEAWRALSNDEKKHYGLLFHPEDVEDTKGILDNFINHCLK